MACCHYPSLSVTVSHCFIDLITFSTGLILMELLLTNLFEGAAVFCKSCLTVHDNSIFFIWLLPECKFAGFNCTVFWFCEVFSCLPVAWQPVLLLHLSYVFIPLHIVQKHAIRMCSTVLNINVNLRGTMFQSELSAPIAPVTSTCATSVSLFYVLVLISPNVPLLPQMMTLQVQCKYI